MKRELNIIVEELRRLKADGVNAISVSDETLTRLRERARALSPTVEAPEGGSRGEAPPEATAATHERMTPLQPAASPKAATPPSPPAKTLPPPPKVVLAEGDKQTQWEALRAQVLACPTCSGNVKPGRKVVFGVGSLAADIFFIGEAPGADEEIQGEPFVGKAGELLTKMIGAMGFKREEVYIGNIMNWRPSMPTDVGNRAPTQEEMEFCLPYLLAQIEIVKPKVLVALGNTAISGLFGADPKRRLKDVRGQWRDFNGIPTMMTYHPSYLVRNGSNAVKRTVWEDLLQVMGKVGAEISEKQRGYFLRK